MTPALFYYLIKLHYSQTSNFEIMTLLISAIIRQHLNITISHPFSTVNQIMHISLSTIILCSQSSRVLSRLSMHIRVIPLSRIFL